MNITTPKINIQAQLWALIGPLLIIMTLFIVLLRTAAITWELPLIAISGLIMCYKWHWKGVFSSTILLIALATHHLIGDASHDWIWIVTLTLSLVVALIVTGLTVEESHHAWDVLYKEVEGGKKNLTNLTESIQSVQNKYLAERQELTSKLDLLQKELSLKKEKEASSERLISIVREELTVMHEGQERLLQELYEAKALAANVLDPFNPSSSNVILPSVHSEQVSILKTLLETRDLEIQELKAKEETLLMEQKLARDEALFALSEQQKIQDLLQSVISQNEIYVKEKNLLESTISRLQEETDRLTHANKESVDLLAFYKTSIQEASLKDREQHNELEILKAALKELQDKTKEREELLQDYDLIKLNLQEQESRLKEASSREELLSAQYERSRSEMADLKAKYKEAAIAEISLKEELDAAKRAMITQEVKYAESLKVQENIAQADLEVLKDHVKSLELDCKECATRELEYKEQLELMSFELKELQDQYIEASVRELNLKEELLTLKDSVKTLEENDKAASSLQGEIERYKLQIESLESKAKELESARDEFITKEYMLKAQHDVTENQLKTIQERYEQLSSQESQLRELYEESSKKYALLSEQNIQAKVEVDSSVNHQDIRRLEGLYKQMRDQFNQKSATLDATRKELFLTQERVAVLQKEMDETVLKADLESEHMFGNLLKSNVDELDHVKADYESEIASLQEIITKLAEV